MACETPFVTVTPWPIWSSFDGITQFEAQLGAQPVNIDPTAAATYGIPGTVTGNAAVGVTERQYIQFSSFEGQAARRNLIGNNTAALVRCVGGNDQLPRPLFRPAVRAGSRATTKRSNHPAYSIRVGSGLTGVDTIWAPINTWTRIRSRRRSLQRHRRTTARHPVLRATASPA